MKLKDQLDATVQKLDESREVLKTNENGEDFYLFCCFFFFYAFTVYLLFIRAEQLIAFAIISRYEKTRFFNRSGCDYTVMWHTRVMYDDRMISKYS